MNELLFGSKSRAELLRLLFEGTHRSFYLRELERESGINASGLLKEIKKLLTLELITSKKDGNRIYYRANRDHPIYLELQGIVEKTSGVQAILKTALNDPRIQLALLFGSVAKSGERAESDVDLIVIGKIGLRALSQLLVVPQEKISRPINPVVYTPEEFSTKLAAKNHFLSRVFEKEFVVLAGDINDFKALKKLKITL
jgi:uncharacterized protein